MNKYFLLVILFYISLGKRIKHTFSIRHIDDWHYISKFGADTGDVNYSLIFRILFADTSDIREIPVKYELYLDEEWPQAISKHQCERHTSARRNEEIKIPVNNEYVFTGTLSAVVRAHLWYFAFSDCDRRLRDAFAGNDKVRFEVELHIRNPGNTEFTLEQFGIVQLMSIIAFIDVVMLIYNGNQILVKQKKYEEFSLPLFFLVITLLLETLSYCIQVIHLLIYSENGQGVLALQVISAILSVASQFSLTMILVMLSWGWQINFAKFDNFELFIPISLLIGFFQVTLVGVSFVDYDAYYKDHAFEGWVGWLASLIYVGEFMYFVNGLMDTSRKSSQAVQQFILTLGIYGGCYFISLPVLQTVNLFIARYIRYKVMEIGTIVFRTAAILLLSRLFTSKKSLFAQISIENKSFLDRSKEE